MESERRRSSQLVFWALLAVLAGTLYTAFKVTDMRSHIMSGQSMQSECVEGPAKTERYVDETPEAWRRRHEEGIQNLGGLKARER